MPALRATGAIPRQRTRTHSHRQERSHARQRWIASGAYRVTVKQPPEVGRQRFARFVSRVLNEARDRGMNDADIHEATKISPSTFHRWQRGDFRTAPDVAKITSFCEGLGVPAGLALRALGAEEGRDEPAPEPAMDPDVRKILRALTDPNVGETDKILIRETLRMLATRVTPGRRGR